MIAVETWKALQTQQGQRPERFGLGWRTVRTEENYGAPGAKAFHLVFHPRRSTNLPNLSQDFSTVFANPLWSVSKATVLPVALRLRGERVRPFDGEARFPHLGRIGRRDARKLRPHVVDDVEIAVRPVVVAQTQIDAGRLGVRGIHLQDGGKRQKAAEGIVPLQTCQHYGEISVRQRQPEAIPGLRRGDRKPGRRTIVGANAKLIQRPSVISAKPLKKIVRKSPVLSRSVGYLVPREVVEPI